MASSHYDNGDATITEVGMIRCTWTGDGIDYVQIAKSGAVPNLIGVASSNNYIELYQPGNSYGWNLQVYYTILPYAGS